MNLNCVICGELFTSSSDVQITPCGHMYHTACILQWLERSKTCPQCRTKCLQKSIHKVFFNIANLDSSQVDIASLQQELDNNILKYNLSEKELDDSRNDIENLRKMQKNCIKTISGLERKLQENQFLIQSYQEQFKIFKTNLNILTEQRKEIKELKHKIELLSTVDTILTSTLSDVEKLSNSCMNKETLSTWVVTLKRELSGSENKRTDLRNALKVVQHNSQKDNIAKKALLEKVLELESENYHLNHKIKELSNGNNSLNSTDYLRANQLHIINTPTKNGSLNIKKESTCTISNNNTPTLITKNLKEIVESTSPYLNIKSSSIGLSPLLNIGDRIRDKSIVNNNIDDNQYTVGASSSGTSQGTLKKSNNDLSEVYTIFKKPRLTSLPKNHYLPFNGFGASERQLDENFTINIKKNPNLNNRIKNVNVQKFNTTETYSLDD